MFLCSSLGEGGRVVLLEIETGRLQEDDVIKWTVCVDIKNVKLLTWITHTGPVQRHLYPSAGKQEVRNPSQPCVDG